MSTHTPLGCGSEQAMLADTDTTDKQSVDDVVVAMIADW